jgi:2'-5' RNA ligase
VPEALHSAVVVAVPEAAPVVDPWRERTLPEKPSIGIPPHVTLLTPFAPPDQIDERALRELFALYQPFMFRLARTARFPELVYLEPEPAEPFVRMTEALVERFPEYPPYEGAFASIVPHLTVASGDEAVLAEAEAAIRPSVPIEAEAREAVLLVEVVPWARWETRARFAFAGPTRPVRT